VLLGKTTKMLDLQFSKPDDLTLVGVPFVGRDFECRRCRISIVYDQLLLDFTSPPSRYSDIRNFVEPLNHDLGQLFLVFGQRRGRLRQEAFEFN